MSRHSELLAEIRELIQPWLDELRRDIISSNSVNERGAHKVDIAAAPAGSGVRATTVTNELKGYAFSETTGAAGATVVLRDGADPSGPPSVTVDLVAGESVRDWFGENGITFIDGVYVDRVIGSVSGSVWLRGGGAT